MAGFKKAQAQQAFAKIGVYGPPGSGKTFTSLLLAEGFGASCGKRVAFVDTERGTDFYAQEVPGRKNHPKAFDFDALYSRSIVDVLETVKVIDTAVYGVLVIDSISHIWDAAIAAYKGKTTSIGTIPINAWGTIKKPYKDLMAALLSAPIHVIICGRQANEMGENPDGEMTKIGVKMRAEGETQYEPHITIRMEASKPRKAGEVATVMAIIEKDRTGLLQGKVIPNPTFAALGDPILPLLGSTQARVDTEDEVGQRDAEAMSAADAAKARESASLLTTLKAELDIASTKGAKDLEATAKKLITPETKKKMLTPHVAELREHYNRLAGAAPSAPKTAEVAA